MDRLMNGLVDGVGDLADAFDDLSDFLDDTLGLELPGPLLFFLVLCVIVYVAKGLLQPR